MLSKIKNEKYFSKNIKYLSAIKNSQLDKYYSNAGVMVQPSIENGFGLVIVEALACDCPVIATENTGAMIKIKKIRKRDQYGDRCIPKLNNLNYE